MFVQCNTEECNNIIRLSSDDLLRRRAACSSCRSFTEISVLINDFEKIVGGLLKRIENLEQDISLLVSVVEVLEADNE